MVSGFCNGGVGCHLGCACGRGQPLGLAYRLANLAACALLVDGVDLAV